MDRHGAHARQARWQAEGERFERAGSLAAWQQVLGRVPGLRLAGVKRLDMRMLAPDEAAAKCDEVAEAERLRPWAADASPLRLTLARTTPEGGEVVLTVSPAVVDERRMLALVASLHGVEPPALSLDRALPTGASSNAEDPPGALSIVSSSSNPPRRSGVVTVGLPDRLRDAPATFALGAWALVAARYARAPGVTLAIVGGATVAVRIDDDCPLRDWLREPAVLASADRETAHLALRLDAVPPEAWAHAAGSVVDVRSEYDLPLVGVVHGGGRPAVELTYRRDLVDGDAALSFAEQVAGVFERLSDHLDRPPCEVPVVREDDRAAWARLNRTDARRDAPLATELVLRQAAEQPSATAVVAGARTLTYGELVHRASQLAHHLSAAGLGMDDAVGVLLPRTADLPVALLGTLLAGCAYVPLDPAYPEERLRLMMEDAGLRALVTASEATARAGARTATVVRLDADGDRLARLPTTPPDVTIPPHSAAYVVYTSGSTGIPKGVVIEHANLAAFLAWTLRAFTATEHEAVAAATSACFDLSVYELLAPPAAGGTVVLVDDAVALASSPPGIDITLVNSVPSAMETLLQLDALPPTVRTCNLAGEPLQAHLLGELLARPGVKRVANLYGPSETTIYSTAAFFDSTARHEGMPPIGRPIHGTQAWVLDTVGELVPPGVPGELFIGGKGVGRGYLGLPALTAERFVPDPFGGVPGGRLYRTGDIVRLRPDGELEYLGRSDHQVKVRGFRVELGEVETALLAHPAVREAVVAVIGDSAAERRLGALVVTSDGMSPASADLEAFLVARLPAFQVPQAIALVDELPRTPNGKVDRAAAVAVLGNRPPAPAATGRTPTEEGLARIWGRVLDVDATTLSPDDDFFRLGGQSLLAMRVVAAVAADFGVELRVPVVFEHRTLGALAARIDGDRRRGRRAIQAAGRRHGPLTALQRTFLGGAKKAGVSAVGPVYRLTGSLDIEALQHAVDEVVRRHEALRTAYPPSRLHPRQVIRPWEPHPIEVVNATERKRGRVDPRAVIAEALLDEFDFASGPLLRTKLVRTGVREHLFCLSVNEIAADGLSMPLLLAEVAALYAAFSTGESSPLAPLPIQYLDYARHLRRVERRARRRQLSFWKAALRDAPVALDLAPDRWPEAFDAPLACTAHVEVDASLETALQELVRREGTTLFTVLAAAFEAIVQSWTGSDDVVIRCTFADRSRPEVAPLVGLFMNFLLVSTDVSGDPTFREHLGRVGDALKAATENADVPWAEVRRRLAPIRSARGRLSVGLLRFQVVSHTGIPAFSLGDVKVTPEPQPIAPTDHFAFGCLERTDGTLELSLNYDGSLFTEATVGRFLDRFCALVRQATHDPDAPLSSLLTLSRRDMRGARISGPGGATLAGVTVGGLFEEQVRRRGDAVAVESPGGTTTYAELRHQADTVTAALRRRGAVGTPVGVVYEPSVAFVAGLLGALNAGMTAVFVGGGAEGATLLRTLGADAVTGGALDGRANLPVVGPDGAPAGEPAATRPAPEDIAMALPGPRGTVLVTHRTLAHAATGFAHAHRLRSTDRVGSHGDIPPERLAAAVLGPLTVGSACVLGSAPDEGRLSVWFTSGTPILPDGRTPLRLVVTDDAHARDRGRGRLQVVVQRSATETAGPWFETNRLRSPEAPAPWGHPVAGATAVVLDPSMHPALTGVPGELYIEGAQVGAGYAGDPRATALAFVPDPSCGQPGCRLYRTGLVARMDARNGIEILGEVEHWTIRGHPMGVYLRTIEARLGAHPDITSVTARLDRVLREQRVYVVAVRAPGTAVKGRELRTLLPPGLPAVATPAAIEVADG